MNERIRLRFGGYQTEASVHTRALRLLAAEVGKQLGPTAEIDLVANVTEQGRKAVDLFAMVAGDALDLCYFSSSYVEADQAPALAALDLPFLITERDRVFAKLDGAFGARIASELAAASPYRLLGFWDNGVRHLSNRLHPIRTPADCAGLRLRTTANALHQEIFSAIGFVPMAIDPKDLPQAVTEHVVDAQENPLTNLVQFGLYRTHRHVSVTAHFFGFTVVLVNRGRFDSWSKAIREALQAAVRQATVQQRQFAIDEDARCLTLLQADGIASVPAEAIDRAAFKAAVAAILAREAARIGPDVVAELQG